MTHKPHVLRMKEGRRNSEDTEEHETKEMAIRMHAGSKA